MQDYVLELKNITKRFPGVVALDDVSFNLKKGEVHALMGENGAGKSTFIKVITGVHRSEEGDIFLRGEKIVFSSPLESKRRGISAIYQHPTSYLDLSVTENVFSENEIKNSLGLINWKEMHKIAAGLLSQLKADFSPKDIMGNLSVAQQQIVEIAKALSLKAQIIIMDEPTAALTKRESEELYSIARKLRDEGKSIILISHRFEDMYELADRVTVLRDAKYIGTWDIDDINDNVLVNAMVGREISDFFPSRNAMIKEEIFRAENLSIEGVFSDISFDVKSGEVVVLTGLVGAGRSELCQAIYGISKLEGGRIFISGDEIAVNSSFDAIKNGIAYLPEDRQHQGLILDWPLDKNITLSVLDSVSKFGWIDREKERGVSEDLFEKLDVKATGINALAESLSGGNQQKVIVAKILALGLKFIMLDEPTKGVDVGAKNAIYKIINELVESGFAILMISSEMPEVLAMSDRILVMKNGRIQGEMTKKEATQEKILMYAMADVEKTDPESDNEYIGGVSYGD